MKQDEFFDRLTDMFITATQWYEVWEDDKDKRKQQLDKMNDIMNAAEKVDFGWGLFCERLEEKGFHIEDELKRLELWTWKV